MALKDILEGIAKQCDEYADTSDEGDECVAAVEFRSVARQLRMAIKLAPELNAPPHVATRPAPTSEEVQARRNLNVGNDAGLRMVLCTGGPCDGDMIGIPIGMPVGASTFVGGSVYTLTANGLEYNEAQTAKAREAS